MDVDTIRRICRREGLIIKRLKVSNHKLYRRELDESVEWQEMEITLEGNLENFDNRSDFIISIAEMRIGDFVPVNISSLPESMSAVVNYSVE